MQRLGAARHRRESRHAVAHAQDGRQHRSVAGDEVPSSPPLPEPLRDLREQPREDAGVGLAPRRRVQQTSPAIEEVEALDERGLAEERLEPLRPQVSALDDGAEPHHDVVVGLADEHLDLVGRHRGDVARLLAEEQLGRALPLPQGDPAEHGHDDGRHGNDQGEDGEARRRGGHLGRY